jgi:hypothetical protein
MYDTVQRNQKVMKKKQMQRNQMRRTEKETPKGGKRNEWLWKIIREQKKERMNIEEGRCEGAKVHIFSCL